MVAWDVAHLSRRAMLLVLGTLLLAAVLPSVEASPSIDEQQTSGTNGTTDRSGFWQAITVDASRMTSVDLYMYGPCASGMEPYRITFATGTDPNSGVLSDTDWVRPSGTGYAWVTVDVADFSTTPGQVIYLHVRATQQFGPWSCQSWLMVGSGNPYTRGDMSWGSTYDVAFKLWGDYYETGVSSGTAASSTLFGSGDRRFFTLNAGSNYRKLTVFEDSSSNSNDYDLFVKLGSRASESNYDCAQTSSNADETCTLDLPSSGTWYITVKDYAGSGAFSLTATLTSNSPPGTFTLSSPVNGATNQPTTVTLSWQSTTDPDGDSVRYYAYLDTSTTPTTQVCGPVTTTSCSASGLSLGVTYHWRVRANDGLSIGNDDRYSTDTFGFTTTPPNHPPNAPTNSGPANGATKQANNPSLTWSAPSTADPDGDAVAYTTYLGTSDAQPPGSAVSCSSVGTSYTCATSGLAWGSRHYWQVKADDGKGGVAWGSRWNFLTNQYPYVPSPTSPSDGTGGLGVSLTLQWSGGDPDGTTPSYTVFLGTSNPPTSTPSGCSAITTTSCSVSGLTGHTLYYWKVTATDNTISGSPLSQTGGPWTFSTANRAPGAFSNSAPADGAAGVSRNPTMSWTAPTDPDGDAISYTLMGGPTGAFGGQCYVSTTTCTWSNLDKGQKYNWYVVADDGHQGSSVTSTTSFTVQPNRAPTASFTQSVNGLAVNFDGTHSSDPDGDALSYSWTFGDGATGAGPRPSHTFPCLGPYTVQLTVDDGFGGANSARQDVSPVQTTDNDGDGLVACRESAQGTSDFDPDTDDDGVNDLVESMWYTNRVATFCNADGSSCMTPHPTEPDLYVEMDWYQGHFMNGDGAQQVIDRYNNAPRTPRVHLQVDLGQYGGGGTDLGPGSTVTFDDARKNRATNMASARQSIFHYGVVACQQPGDIAPVWYDPGTWHQAWGLSHAPDNFFILYQCNYAPEVATYAADRQVFQHELGHNVLGQWHDKRAGCEYWYDREQNPLLGHFDGTEDGVDCDGDGVKDTFAHSPDSGDIMNNHFQLSDDFRDATWRAIKLNWATNGNGIAPECPTPVATVSNSIDPSLLGCGIAQPVHVDTGDLFLAELEAAHGPSSPGALPGLLTALGVVVLIVRSRRPAP